MCFPAAIPIALALAGGGFNYLGARAAEKASNRAMEAERVRQQGMERQQTEALARSEEAARRLRDPAAQGQAVDNRRQAFIAALNRAPANQGILPGDSTAPRVVADSANQVVANQRGYSEGQANSLAELTAFGDQLLGTNIDINRQGQQIGQIGQSRRRSANLLDGDLRAAANKGATLRGIGMLLQTVGQAAGMGGGFGGGGAGKMWMPSGAPTPDKFLGIY